MAKLADDDDLDLEVEDADTDTADSDEDEAPKPKKVKAKVVEIDDDEEAPRPKKKVAAKAAANDDDEDEEKRVVSRKPKSNKGKEGKTKMATKEKAHRSPKRTDKPYGDKSLIGKAFNLASSDEGVAVKKLRALAEKYKSGKTPAYWIITDLRRGAWKTAAGLWRWDREEENGVLKIHNLRLKRPKAA